MKLIIQVPCYNEGETLSTALSALPREIQGIGEVEFLVIDDGSHDNTIEVAQKSGVEHIVRHTRNQGLARAFSSGLEACLKAGADIIVNTDADNQYEADDIPKLVKPILDGEAEIVIGARPIDDIEHFSLTKRLLQKIGSWVVRTASRSQIPDAPSGFRAFSREAASKLVVFSEYTYTLETIIQAGQKNIAMVSVPIRTNPDLRPSRLVKSITSYVRRSIFTIIRIFAIYRPMAFFGSIGLLLFSTGVLLGIRFLWFYFSGEGEGHVQSVILSAVFLVIGFQTVLIAFMADLLAANRKMLEDVRYTLKQNQRKEL